MQPIDHQTTRFPGLYFKTFHAGVNGEADTLDDRHPERSRQGPAGRTS